VPGGEYPFWVVIKGSDTAYISSVRDREIVVVKHPGQFAPRGERGSSFLGQPNKMVLNRSQSTLVCGPGQHRLGWGDRYK